MLRTTALRPFAAAFKAHARPQALANASIRHFSQSVTGITRPRVPLLALGRPTRVQTALLKTSSIQRLAANVQEPPHEHDEAETDMMSGIKKDFHAVKEAFALNEVPPEVLWVGMAGLTPYVVTSFTTLYLAWDINYAREMGMGYIVNPETAEALLHLLEPIQIGLGAIILSFLGAVHWGLEMAGYGGNYPYRRYTIGILAPALAWPTILLPLDLAMLTQFAGFVGMYFVDSRATQNGWAPRWYMTYRFILTFVVGACIIMTLIGRGQIGELSPAQSARIHLAQLRARQREAVQKEAEERVRRVRMEAEKVLHSKEAKAVLEKLDEPGTQSAAMSGEPEPKEESPQSSESQKEA